MDNFHSNIENTLQQTQTTDGVFDIKSYVSKLIQEKLRLAEEGRYIEADQLKRRIHEIEMQIDNTTSKNIESQQEVEIRYLEEEYERELNEFQSHWDARFAEFDHKSKMEENVLAENHNNEMNELSLYIEEVLPKSLFLKYSKEYLDLRQIEINMKKQEMYLEAHLVKIKADMKGKDEIDKYNKEKENVVKSKIEKLMKKQNLEKNALQEKNFIEYEVLKKDKDASFEKMIQRFKNRKNDLDKQHKTQKLYPSNKNLLKASKCSVII
jgi:hypothetical protein